MMRSIADPADHATIIPCPDSWETTTAEQKVSTSFGQINVRTGARSKAQ